MKEQHKLLRKPWISLIIYPIFATVVYVGIIGGTLSLFMPKINIPGYDSNSIAGRLGLMTGGIIALLIHWFSFRKELAFGSWLRNIPKGLLLGTPLLVTAVLNLLSVDLSSVSRGLIITAFLESLAPAIHEEACFRVLPISTAMWSMREEKKIPLILFLPAAVFALFHIGAGADPMNKFLSVLFALGLGLMNGVIYLRSGSFVPSMVYHLLINFTANLETVGAVSGTSAANKANTVITIVICIAYVVLAFFSVRPAVRPDIMNIWDRKIVEQSEQRK